MRVVLRLSVLAAFASLPTLCLAQQEGDWGGLGTAPATPPPSDRRPEPRGPYAGIVELDVAYFSRGQDESALRPEITLVSPLLRAEYHMGRLALFGDFAAIGAFVASRDPDEETTWRTANPTLGAGYARSVQREKYELEFLVGGRLALPVATAAGDAESYALDAGWGLRGGRDPWHWQRDALSVTTPLRSTLRLPRGRITAALEAGALLPLRERDDAEGYLQVQLEGAFEVVDDRVELGAGVLSATILGEAAQTSLRAFLLSYVSYLHLGMELWVNLDDPHGFAFDEGIWGLAVRLGVRLPG